MTSDHFDSDSLSQPQEPLDPPEMNSPGLDGPMRLLTVMTSPRASFESLAAKPQAWLPLLALIIIMLVTTAVTYHISAPEQMELALEGPFGERLANDEDYLESLEEAYEPTMKSRILGGVQGTVGVIIFVALSALFYHLFAKVFGGTASLKLTFAVVFVASWVGIGIGTVATLPLVLAKQSSLTVGYSLGTLLQAVSPDVDTSGFLYRFLQSFTNIFSIWMLFLLVMGSTIVHRMSSGKAWAAMLIPWLFGNSLALGLAMAFA